LFLFRTRKPPHGYLFSSSNEEEKEMYFKKVSEGKLPNLEELLPQEQDFICALLQVKKQLFSI
jgi:hypothetical protein